METNNVMETNEAQSEMPKETKKPKNNKKKRKVIVSVLAVLAVAIIGTGSYLYSTTKKWNNLIMPNVYVEGVNLTGLTIEEANDKLVKEFGNAILDKKLEIIAGEKTYEIGYDQLNASYNIEETVNNAFGYGKDLSFVDKLKIIYEPTDEELELEFSYNEEPINEVISQIEEETNKEAKPGAIKYLGNSEFEVTDDVKGAIVYSKELVEMINEKIKEEEGAFTVEAPIEELIAEPTGDQLRTVNTIEGSYHTSYSTSSWARSTNIGLATASINGTLLMPGEEFSFNEVVGKRTAAAGYQEAPVIVRGQLEPGLGGGICQVSTTLYNAALLGGYEITERSHHSHPSSYVAIGRDATVDYGNLDFKFKNNFDYPVYIQGYTKNKVVYFNIFSAKELANKKYSVASDVYATYPAKIETVEDPEMLVGEEEIEKKSYTGYKAKVYRTTYEGDKKIATETVSSDYYVPVNGITRVGTKVVEETPEEGETTEVPVESTETPAETNAETPSGTTEETNAN